MGLHTNILNNAKNWLNVKYTPENNLGVNSQGVVEKVTVGPSSSSTSETALISDGGYSTTAQQHPHTRQEAMWVPPAL